MDAQKEAKAIYLFLINVLSPFRNAIIIQFITSSLWAIDLSLRPYLLKIIINKITEVMTHEQPYKALWNPIILYISVAVFMAFVLIVYGINWQRLSPALKKHVGMNLMDQVMEHSHSFYQEYFAGDLAKKVDDIITGVREVLRLAIDRFFNHILAFGIALYVLWQVNFKLALGLMIWSLIFLVFALKNAFFFGKLSIQISRLWSQLIGQIVDMLSNIMSVRLFSNNTFERIQLDRFFEKISQTEQKRGRLFVKMNTLQDISFVVFQSLCLVWLVFGLQAQRVTTGDVILVLSINGSIMQSLWAISHEIYDFVESIGNISQGLKVIMDPIQICDIPGAQKLNVTQGNIAFEEVRFSYKEGGLLFDKFTVRIPAGQKVGLVGRSGSGKSSFINILLRLYDIDRGTITIDNQDIKSVSQESLRNGIATIPQDSSLFHRTVMENIRYGRISATDEEVIQAAQKAHAHEFIVDLAEGYQTMVGERGVKISGGQRQRIAIARAFLKNAPILILDEATSQLDSITESKIQESLSNLMQSKTTIVIAHRLSTLFCMDRILVFEGAKIVEDGTHQELLAKKGVYVTLWQTQVGSFLADREG